MSACLKFALCLAVLPLAWAQRPDVTIEVRIETSGEVGIRVSPPSEGRDLAPILAAVMQCPGKKLSGEDRFGEFHCSTALRREGVSLEGVLDLSPFTRTRAATDEIQLWLDSPRLGFNTSSTPIGDRGGRLRAISTAIFPAGAPLAPIWIQFGYRPDQLAAIYLPLVAMALALMLIAVVLARAGHADLSRSVFLLGTIFWFGAAARLQAADPLRILLYGTHLGDFAAALLEYCPPLFCVATGVALGNTKRTGRRPGALFAEVFWGFGIFLFPMMGAMGAVPAMTVGDWLSAAPWLLFVPLSFILCRRLMRTQGGSTLRQLSDGELKDRVSELAARAGSREVRLFVSTSTGSQVWNAFAMRRNAILLTAPLIQSLAKREVDAVVAHELSHFGHARRSPWAALAMAAVVFQTPLSNVLFSWAGALVVATLIPAIVFLAALRGARKREFAADAGSVALTGDPRALISALSRIARKNRKPIEINPAAEWFSTHPSTGKRVRALAALGRLEQAELEILCHCDAAGDPYLLPDSLPAQDAGAIFTLAWQRANAAGYSWTALVGASISGLLVAALLDKFAAAGILQLLGGIIAGCAITKALAASVMSVNFARLRRKLALRLGGGGQLVGLAIDNEPRVYNGFRFSDVGFLRFDNGRLCYRSERTAIALNPADVVEVGMVAAAPSSWRRMQPIIRFRVIGFRDAESDDVKAVILHPVEWGATPGRLLRSIEHWKRTATSADSTSVSGLETVQGEPFRVPAAASAARGFRIPGAITLVSVVFFGWFFEAESWPAWYALIITAGAYTFLYLPALLYRPSPIPPVLRPRVDAD